MNHKPLSYNIRSFHHRSNMSPTEQLSCSEVSVRQGKVGDGSAATCWKMPGKMPTPLLCVCIDMYAYMYTHIHIYMCMSICMDCTYMYIHDICGQATGVSSPPAPAMVWSEGWGGHELAGGCDGCSAPASTPTPTLKLYRTHSPGLKTSML